MRSNKVPYLEDDQIERIADEFFQRMWKDEVYPIDVEEICDELGISVIFLPGLKALLSVDAFIASDFRYLYVDAECGEKYIRRCRFSIAHELGHYEMHSRYYPKGIKGISEYQEIMKETDNSCAEYQANMFAGMILVPEKELKRFSEDYLGGETVKKFAKCNLSERGDYLASLVAYFNVSDVVILKRLRYVFPGIFDDFDF